MYSSILGSGEEAADHAQEILAHLSCHGHLAMLAAGVRPDPHPTDVRLCIRRDGASRAAAATQHLLQLLLYLYRGQGDADLQGDRQGRGWSSKSGCWRGSKSVVLTTIF